MQSPAVTGRGAVARARRAERVVARPRLQFEIVPSPHSADLPHAQTIQAAFRPRAPSRAQPIDSRPYPALSAQPPLPARIRVASGPSRPRPPRTGVRAVD